MSRVMCGALLMHTHVPPISMSDIISFFSKAVEVQQC